MIQRVLSIFIVTLLVAGGGYFAYLRILPPVDSEASGPIYATSKVERGDLTVDVETSGPLNPSRGGGLQGPFPDFSSPRAGSTEFIIDKILVQDGDSVSMGQPVIQLAAPSLAGSIEDAEEELKDAREYLADLLGIDSLSVESVNPAQGVTVRAPIEGRIIRLEVAEGDEVQQGSRVAQIVDDSRWRAVALLTSAEFANVRPDDSVFVRFSSFEGFHEAKITKINSNKIPMESSELARCNQMQGFSSGSGESGRPQFMYQVDIEGHNPGLIQPGMQVEVGFAGKSAVQGGESPPQIHWLRYCAEVKGYVEEERVFIPTEGIVTRVFVDEMAVVKPGDALVAVTGDETQTAIEENLQKIRDKERELTNLRAQFEQLVVRSPMDGVIANINVQEGQSIQFGEYLGSVFNTSDMRMWVQVDELDVLRVRQDAEVEITVDALPGMTFSGRVTEIATAGQNESGITQFQVGIQVRGGPDLRPGMQARARIKAGSAQNVLLVPLEAVFEEEGKSKVEILQPDGTPRVVQVELGLMNDRVAEVLSGLEEGQTVITGSSADVLPSQRIQTNDLLPAAPGDDGQNGGGDGGEQPGDPGSPPSKPIPGGM